MNSKRFLFILVALLFMTLLIMYVFNLKIIQSHRDFSDIKRNNTLNVVTGYNSIDYNADGDSITGLQYELCRFIAQRSGLTIQHFFEKDFETAVPKLLKNVYDVIAQNITITKDNKQFLAFTVPITQSKQVLVQRKSSDDDTILFITNQLDLAKQTIYVTKNSPAILRLKNLAEEIAEPINIKEIADNNPERLIYMVDNKEIDYAAINSEISEKNAKIFPDLDFNIEISFTQLQAWALRKTSPVLLDSLNVWITEFKERKP